VSVTSVFQLFDTWAGILRAQDYEQLVLPYVQQIFSKLDLPSIYYLKNGHHLLTLMLQSQADFISVCNTVDLTSDERLANIHCGIQGNLYNGLVYADFATLQKELLLLLQGTRRFKRYIFNLSHGIFPDTEVEKIKFIVDHVHEFVRNK